MNLSQIRQETNHRLHEDQGNLSKLVLIHTSITIVAYLLLMLVSWLSQNVSLEGGLSNMGTQNLLSSGQVLLQLLLMIAAPLWEAGLIFCSLKLVQNERYTTGNLTEGFRRFGPIISSLVIRGLIYFGVAMACYFASSIITSFLPFPGSLIDDLAAFMEAPAFPMATSVRNFLLTLGLVYCLCLCAVLVPRLYLHRLVSFRIMDHESCGGLQSVLHSRLLMKGHRKSLFMLDLSYWWFYALEFAIGALSIGYLFIPGINIDIAMWAFPACAWVAQLALYWFAKPKITISYALFYRKIYEESLKDSKNSEPK